MTKTPWILTEVHRSPDCLEWIISTTRPATNGCKPDPLIAIFDEMGGSGDGRREGRLNAILATTAPDLLKVIINARRSLMKNRHHVEKSGFHRGQYVGYGGGKVWSIHPSTSAYGKWRAFNQRNPAEYRYGWTLTELDAYFHSLNQTQKGICHLESATHALRGLNRAP